MIRFRTYFFELILWMLPFSVAIWALLKYVLPERYFNEFTAIPAFIVILGTVFFFFLKAAPKMSSRNLLLLYSLNLMIKLVLSGIVVGALCYNNKPYAIEIVCVYFIFYILLTVFETRCFMKAAKLKAQ